jgi:hypothetical protein
LARADFFAAGFFDFLLALVFLPSGLGEASAESLGDWLIEVVNITALTPEG